MSTSVGPIVGRASSFAGRKVACAASNGTAKVSMRATWMPGSAPPAYLDGSMPCDYGFDPFGLGKEPAQLARFQEAEIIHCRWAMLGITGVAGVEALGFGTWIEAGPDTRPHPFLWTFVTEITKLIPQNVLGLI